LKKLPEGRIADRHQFEALELEQFTIFGDVKASDESFEAAFDGVTNGVVVFVESNDRRD
jgi:hypothetical protein